MGEGGTPEVGGGVTVLSLGLPSGDGYAVTEGGDPAGLRTENGRLVLFASLDDACAGRTPARVERHDLVAVGAGLISDDDRAGVVEAAGLLRRLAALVGADVEEHVGPSSAVGRIVAGRVPAATADRPALAMTYGLMAQSSPSNAMMIRGEAQHAWMSALQTLEQHVRWVGEPAHAAKDATALEDLVPGVEVLWVGADDYSGYTLRAWADPANDQDTRFLGRSGQVVAFAELGQLAAYLRESAPAMPGVPQWHRLTEEDLDLEPYEEAVVDLDELGTRIEPALTAGDGTELTQAAGLLRDLAVTLDAAWTIRALQPDRPLGLFLARDLPDLHTNPVAAHRRLRDTDLESVQDHWREAVTEVAAHIDWHGSQP